MPSSELYGYDDELEPLLDRLLEDYRDLQAPIIARRENPPTPVEALRMVHTNHPTVIRGCTPLEPLADQIDWDEAESYTSILGKGQVTIAITDDGYADSVRTLQDGSTSFVKPLEQRMPINNFLDILRDPTETEIMYLQSQDGNIYRSHPRSGGDELEGIRKYVKRDIEWMSEAVGESAEAVNLWIGSNRSITSLHHDPYENIYHVLSGTKTFTLVSPIEGLWLNQSFHPPSTLHRRPSSLTLQPILDPPPAHPVPWVQSSDIPPPIQPIVVTLHKGETLYLPRGWWHRVEQAAGPGGLAVAINYWYNSTIHPRTHALEKLSQRIARRAGRQGVIPVDIESESDGEVEVAGTGVPEGVWADDSGSGEEWEPSDWGR